LSKIHYKKEHQNGSSDTGLDMKLLFQSKVILLKISQMVRNETKQHYFQESWPLIFDFCTGYSILCWIRIQIRFQNRNAFRFRFHNTKFNNRRQDQSTLSSLLVASASLRGFELLPKRYRRYTTEPGLTCPRARRALVGWGRRGRCRRGTTGTRRNSAPGSSAQYRSSTEWTPCDKPLVLINKQQCCRQYWGSGSGCFWASRIRFH
jgi:hypothetical protein